MTEVGRKSSTRLAKTLESFSTSSKNLRKSARNFLIKIQENSQKTVRKQSENSQKNVEIKKVF